MTGTKFSLVDLGKLSKPISKLIEAVSQGIGALYEPTKVRRKAKAQADASLIRAEADIKKKELLQRAVNRFTFQEISRQENIENIIKIAASSLPETVSEEPVDKDWISRFFDDCKDVSSAELQGLWGRLLAVEVASPSCCSRKTMAILKDLSPLDCKLFTTLCRLIWSCGKKYFIPHERDVVINSQIGKYGINYDALLHLETFGLVHSRHVVFSIGIGDKLKYFNWDHHCSTETSHEDENTWVIKIYVSPLTQAGIELYSVAKSEPNYSYYKGSIRMFREIYDISLNRID